jgi:hypothetical protein
MHLAGSRDDLGYVGRKEMSKHVTIPAKPWIATSVREAVGPTHCADQRNDAKGRIMALFTPDTR